MTRCWLCKGYGFNSHKEIFNKGKNKELFNE
jgi:hypothetical protein